MSGLAFWRVRRERKFAILLLGILTAGLIAWIVLPSLADQIEAQLRGYADRASTYIVVSNKLGSPLSLSQNATISMMGIQGVEAVYPFNVNVTSIEYHNVTVTTIINGSYTQTTLANFTVGIMSAPIGPGHFPPALINLIDGKMPSDSEPGFVSNCGVVNLKTKTPMAVGDVFKVSVGGVSFNATLTGKNAITLLTNEVCILWNETFLKQKLGNLAFSSTFEHPGSNYVVLKVDRIEDVRPVVTTLTMLLTNFPGYVATYDEAALANLEIFQRQSAPLYVLIGWISPILAGSVTFLASYLSIGRRSWEPALLISLGWTRRSVLRFLVTYYGLVSSIALALAVAISYGLSWLLTFRYEVFGAYLVASFTPSYLYVLASIPSAYGISSSAALIEILRVKRTGIDVALREF